MKKIIFLALVSVSFIQAESILIKSGTILDGSGENQFKADILIDGARIIEIGSGINESKADRLIDASDKIVTPGLISPISNIGVVEINALDVTTDDESSIYGPGFSIFYAFNPNSTLIPWNKSNGVTSAISTPGYSNEIFKGMGSYFLLDGKYDITGLQDIAMYARIGNVQGSRSENIQLMESMLLLAQKLNSDNISELLDDNLASSFGLLEQDIIALNKVAMRELPIVIEVNRAADILQALRLKKIFNLDMILMSVEEAPLIIQQIKDSGVPVIIDPMDNIPNSFDELASDIKLGGILDKNGIKVMFSTQRSHNYHLMRQGAGNAVAHGMSYKNAIRGMTLTVAETFKLKDRGQIKKGNFADIVIWTEDPLEQMSYPLSVLINGEIQDLTTRSDRLTERYTNTNDLPKAYIH